MRACKYVKDNYYARLHDPSMHRYRERHLSILLDANVDGQTDGWTDERTES